MLELLAAYCLAAGCSLPFTATLDDPRNFPRGVVATTTIEGGRCYLSFTPVASRSKLVLAHEACHCALDLDAIGPYGYTSPDRHDIKRREARASDCARRIVSRD